MPRFRAPWSQYAEKEPRVPDAGLRGLVARARLDEHLPAHHRLSRVYRVGAGLMGAFLCVFGVLSVTANVGMFSTEDNTVLGLNTDGALGWLSIVVGLILLFGMVRGGNVASTLNLVLGVAFVLSGFANLALLETEANILAFRIQNVIFSFAVGVLLMIFGMYGRVSGRLPHDNPYWQARHPGRVEAEQRRREELAARQRELSSHGQRHREPPTPAVPAGSPRRMRRHAGPAR